MTYQTITEYNATGADGLFSYASSVVPIFTPMLLFSFWIIMALSIFFSQKRQSGVGNFAISSAVASYVTMGLAVVLTLIGGMITPAILFIVFAVTIATTLWLLLEKDSSY